MKRLVMAGTALALVLVVMTSDQARAIQNIHRVEYIGADGGQWNDANAWKNLDTNTVGTASALLGRANGSNGLNDANVAASHAQYVTIPQDLTVNYHGNTIGDLRWNRGSVLTIEPGAIWQQVTDATFTENSWTQFDGELHLCGGIFRRSVAAPSAKNDGGGILMFGSYRDNENLGRFGTPPDIKVHINQGGRLENNGQLWFGADDEHTIGLRASVTINGGHMDLTGGQIPQTNSTLVVAADLAFFYDYYRDDIWDAANPPGTPNDDPNGKPKNEQYEINFTGPGSITVDESGIWVYRQPASGIWDEANAGPLSYEDLWDQGILKAHGMSGKTGTIDNDHNNPPTALQPATFSTYFTTSGSPGSPNYTLTSITPELQKVRYIGANGGQWSDANAWRNTTTNTTGNAATILGRANGSNGLNDANVTASHARDVTIPAGVTVNYHGNSIGDIRWNRGSILTIEKGAVWQQVTDATFTENSWSQFDGKMVLDGGTFRRSIAAPSAKNDGGGILMFGSYRDNENLGRFGTPPDIEVDIRNGGRLENNGQLWFGADDEHTVGLQVSMTINNGHLDLTGGQIPQTNSTLVVAADLAFFYDYYRDDIWDAANPPGTPNDDPNGKPKNEQYEINFTGPGSITVDESGIWVYRQPASGIWDEANAGPLSYEDLWNAGILKAFGMSGKTGTIDNDHNNPPTALQPATFSTYFTTSGTPGSPNYTLTSLIAELPDDGDYNDDGTVDAADYVAWRKFSGMFGGDPGYDVWKETFAETSPDCCSTSAAEVAGSNGVPEPGTMLLMLIGLASVSVFTKRSR